MMKTKKHLNFSSEIYPNIFKITLPLPGDKPGPINAYLFIGKNITLLDTGSVFTVYHLKKALEELGLTFYDIDQIILTHGHADHYGAAKIILSESNDRVKVTAHRDDIAIIQTGELFPKKTFFNFLRMIGIPQVFRVALYLSFLEYQSWAENCRVNTIIDDDHEIRIGDYSGKVISTPGHTKGSICIYLKEADILFSGDHILGHMMPNAFVMLEENKLLPERLSQNEFHNSLLKIKALSPSIIHPAHGEAIDNPMEIIESYKAVFSQRQQDILSIIKSGENNVYQIALKLFPDLADTNLPLYFYFAASEVYTHLQVLELKNIVALRINNHAFQIHPLSTPISH